MMQSGGEHLKTNKTSAREAFFLEFAKEVRSRFPNLKLMVTGGFRTRQGMEAAIAEGGCDIVGLGRPAVINPHWPKDVLLNEKVSNEDAQLLLSAVGLPWLLRMVPIKVLGAGAETVSRVFHVEVAREVLISNARNIM
jgi:tRNA-dihydrouridine synthase